MPAYPTKEMLADYSNRMMVVLHIFCDQYLTPFIVSTCFCPAYTSLCYIGHNASVSWFIQKKVPVHTVQLTVYVLTKYSSIIVIYPYIFPEI